MLEGILFELTLIIMQRQGATQDTKIVLECPTKIEMKDMNERYSVSGFRVDVTCKPLKGEPM